MSDPVPDPLPVALPDVPLSVPYEPLPASVSMHAPVNVRFDPVSNGSEMQFVGSIGFINTAPAVFVTQPTNFEMCIDSPDLDVYYQVTIVINGIVINAGKEKILCNNDYEFIDEIGDNLHLKQPGDKRRVDVAVRLFRKIGSDTDDTLTFGKVSEFTVTQRFEYREI